MLKVKWIIRNACSGGLLAAMGETRLKLISEEQTIRVSPATAGTMLRKEQMLTTKN